MLTTSWRKSKSPVFSNVTSAAILFFRLLKTTTLTAVTWPRITEWATLSWMKNSRKTCNFKKKKVIHLKENNRDKTTNFDWLFSQTQTVQSVDGESSDDQWFRPIRWFLNETCNSIRSIQSNSIASPILISVSNVKWPTKSPIIQSIFIQLILELSRTVDSTYPAMAESKSQTSGLNAFTICTVWSLPRTMPVLTIRIFFVSNYHDLMFGNEKVLLLRGSPYPFVNIIELLNCAKILVTLLNWIEYINWFDSLEIFLWWWQLSTRRRISRQPQRFETEPSPVRWTDWGRLSATLKNTTLINYRRIINNTWYFTRVRPPSPRTLSSTPKTPTYELGSLLTMISTSLPDSTEFGVTCTSIYGTILSTKKLRPSATTSPSFRT